MSGLAGVFDPRGGPIDGPLFDRVVSQIAYRGPDGVRTWHGRGVSMAFARFARTPDAVLDRQPLYDAATQTCVSFDGRLDNREDLAAQLGLRLTDSTGDVTLAAAAYVRWGTDCAVRLIGDFSLVVWDGRARRVFAARDIMGLRPLFHREVNGAYWWASDQRALLELGLPPINEGFVGEHLAGGPASIDETIYTGVCRLPSAHALLLGGPARRWRYWRPDAHARLTYRDPRDYDHHYRTLLDAAVRARLRLHGPAALLLSGGIDSGSVAVAIAALRDEGHAAASQVSTLSMTVPGHPACEERVIRQVLEQVRLPHVLLPSENPPEEVFHRDAAASLDLPHPVGSSIARPLYRAALEAGRSVLLTGYGGDDWFDTTYAELGDHLRGGRLVTAAVRLAAMRRVRNQTAASQLLRIGAWMALPEAARGRIRRVLHRNPVPPWIEPDFARRHDLADRLHRRAEDLEFDSLVPYDLFRGASSGAAMFATDQEERHFAAQGLEQRHPLMDRRLVEFALALPPGERCGNGVSKALMRRAMRRDLPPAVTVDPPNDDFGFLGLRAFAHLGGAARLSNMRPIRRGWLRAASIAEQYRGLERGATRCLWPLSAAMAVDFWLGVLEAGPAAHDSNTYGRHNLEVAVG